MSGDEKEEEIFEDEDMNKLNKKLSKLNEQLGKLREDLKKDTDKGSPMIEERIKKLEDQLAAKTKTKEETLKEQWGGWE